MAMEIIISVILLFVGIAILVIIHFCVMGRAFRGEANSGRDLIGSQARRFPSMKAEDIEELPCFEYRLDHEKQKGKGNVIGELCAVCLENFMEGEKCRMLPNCTHSFHVECINSWLLKTGACPICRTGAKSQENIGEDSSHAGEAGVELI